MVKKAIILKIVGVLLIVMLITPRTIIYQCTIDRKAKSWIKYFKDENVEGLFSVFCSDIKDNYADETREEIRKVFEFIDGDIESYEYKGESGSQYAKDNYKTTLYSCYLEFRCKTENEKKYTITILYNYIWKEKPEYEGIERIWIVNYEGDSAYTGERMEIGKKLK